MNYKVKSVYGKVKNKTVEVSVPGSKSITARALLIAALARGESTLYGAQFSDDCLTFLNCLKGLGVDCKLVGESVKVIGCGGKLKNKKAEINVGSAGTAARFLPAFLAFQDGEYTLNCSPQMKKRPIEPLIKSLESLGAKFTFLEEENRYPFVIRGTVSPALSVEVNIEKSSQFLSALLISSVCTGREITINVSGSHGLDYVDMTVKMMKAFGVAVKKAEGYCVCGSYIAREYEIEPDVSAACYFYAANKILGTDITVKGIPNESLQGDMRFIGLLKDFDGGEADMSSFSDQALTLAAIAPYFKNPTKITGVGHIRGQECDRINAIITNLRAMGVLCKEFKDGVEIFPSQPCAAEIQTFGDHRVAMAFSVTGLRAEGIVIKNAEVCSKTFLDYFTVLDGVVRQLT